MCEPCPRLVLADGCLSDRESERWGCWYGGGRWLRGVRCIYKLRQMAGCENLKQRFRFPLCGACRSPGSTAGFAVAAHAVHTGRERVTLLSPRHIEKNSWEKITAAQGERSPERYISPAFTHSDKALSLTALSFLPLAYFIWLSFNGFFVDNVPLFLLYFCSN